MKKLGIVMKILAIINIVSGFIAAISGTVLLIIVVITGTPSSSDTISELIGGASSIPMGFLMLWLSKGFTSDGARLSKLHKQANELNAKLDEIEAQIQ